MIDMNMEEVQKQKPENNGIRLINVSSIRPMVKLLSEGKITSISQDVSKELNNTVERILKEGVRRAKDNNRKTLMKQDL